MLATKCSFPLCYDLRDSDIVLYDFCVKPVRQNNGIRLFIHPTDFSSFYGFLLNGFIPLQTSVSSF